MTLGSARGRATTAAPRPVRRTAARLVGLALALLLAGCGVDTHVPPFARVPYAPFSRQAVVAIALREWRAFGSLTDPDETESMPERQQGLWQRVGEYWWLGLDPSLPEASWTGKHDAQGRIFPPDQDAAFAWSAAFVSYVFRIAGAGSGFPYAAGHDVYIEAALRHDPGLVIAAERPDRYAPRPGDLICAGRGQYADLAFDDLPGVTTFKSHCDIVVRTGGPDGLAAIGGNVANAVALRHFPVATDGRLLPPQPPARWLAILRLRVP